MKNTRELRRFLVKQMEAAAEGDFDRDRSRAVGHMAQQIYNTMSIEVRWAIARAKIGDRDIGPVKFND